MKSLIIALPVLIQLALVTALYQASNSAPAPSAPPSYSSTASEVHQLRQQRDRIEAQLNAIESRNRVFLPRGLGKVAATPAYTASEPQRATNSQASRIQTHSQRSMTSRTGTTPNGEPS
jgi:hypothetical protein